ncbi:MAG: hypothetical protein RBR08_04945 [Desulforegulaceae bacterium]|nr:hypothetical protein [Desulforegulaceae bacterium]
MGNELFSPKELSLLNTVISRSEEMTADFYKMSDSDWKKIKYDFKTKKDLKSHEIAEKAFAQVVKYDARPWGSPFNSSLYTIYRICIQDSTILDRIEKFDFLMDPFLFYIIIHELVHVVRFSKYIKKFEADEEEMYAEEKIVHEITRNIMEKNAIQGRSKVFDFFKNHLSF